MTQEVWHVSKVGVRRDVREVVGESPLLIEIGESHYVLMRTPGHDFDLARGFLFTEGLVESRANEIRFSIDEEREDLIRAHTDQAAEVTPRHMIVNSSCGLCGKDGIYEMVASIQPVESELRIPANVLLDLPNQLRKEQRLFERTGGCHAAGLFDESGRMILVREDIGRHNALDKVIGAALLNSDDLLSLGVFLSGRASLEMVIKASRARVSLIAAVSAPSSAAVLASQKLGVTLCGFVRGEDLVIYTHPERVVRG